MATEREYEQTLDELAAKVKDAEEEFGTDSAEHRGAIEDWTAYAGGTEVEVEPK